MDADRQAEKVAASDARRKIVEALMRLPSPAGLKPIVGAGLTEYPRQGHRTMAVRG